MKTIDLESLAGTMYETYCAGVGGFAFNGDALPPWSDFRADLTKLKQSESWVRAAEAASGHLEATNCVPGLWMCPACNFRVAKRIIGRNTVSDDPAMHSDPCPNDGETMLPVTWEDYSKGVELFAEMKVNELREYAEKRNAGFAAAFTEWERRFREEPEKFLADQERIAMSEQDNGEICALYFIQLLEELSGENKVESAVSSIS